MADAPEKTDKSRRGKFERLLQAACLMSDLCWNEHEDIRGTSAQDAFLDCLWCHIRNGSGWRPRSIIGMSVTKQTNPDRQNLEPFLGTSADQKLPPLVLG